MVQKKRCMFSLMWCRAGDEMHAFKVFSAINMHKSMSHVKKKKIALYASIDSTIEKKCKNCALFESEYKNSLH